MTTEGEKNSAYATISLFSGIPAAFLINLWNVLPIGKFDIFYEVLQERPLFKLSFLITNLALQIFEGKIKFQSPITFN